MMKKPQKKQEETFMQVQVEWSSRHMQIICFNNNLNIDFAVMFYTHTSIYIDPVTAVVSYVNEAQRQSE